MFFKRSILTLGSLSLLAPLLFAGVGLEITSPKTWNVTQNEPGGTAGHGVWTYPNVFSIKNIGTEQANVYIRANNTRYWNLADDGITGPNRFAMHYRIVGGDDTWYPISKTDTQSTSPLGRVLDPDQIFNLDLKYESPTMISPQVSEVQQSTITLSALSKDFARWERYESPEPEGVVLPEYYSLCFDANNFAHTAYICVNDFSNLSEPLRVKYAYQGWTTSLVEEIPHTERANFGKVQIDLDGSSVPHLFYGWIPDFSNQEAIYKYAKLNEGVWEIEVVPMPANTYMSFAAFRVDATGKPHIACISENNQLNYLIKNGSEWSVQNICSGNMDAGGPVLALDSSGYPHILFCDYQDKTIARYARWDGTSWVIETITLGYEFVPAGLAFGQDATPYVALFTIEGSFRYAKRLNSGWDSWKVVELGEIARQPGMAIDSGGMPEFALCMRDAYSGQYPVNYVRWTGNEWSYTPVFPEGEQPVLVLDRYDMPSVLITGIDVFWGTYLKGY